MRIFLLLGALIALTACDASFGGRRYLPADSEIDPYAAARAQAEEYYQAGLAAESQGRMNQGLDDFRQARLWDRDGRQDIQAALSRAEAKVNRASRIQPTPTSVAPGISLRPFHSLAFPYTISIPVGWVAKQDKTEGQPIDTFASPATATPSAFMLITVDAVDADITLDQLYVGSKQSLESDGVSSVQIVDRRLVAEQPAYVMSYRTDADSGQASVLHAIFVTPAHAWHIILIATPATTAELVKTFDVMLDSMTLQSSAFPVL